MPLRAALSMRLGRMRCRKSCPMHSERRQMMTDIWDRDSESWSKAAEECQADRRIKRTKGPALEQDAAAWPAPAWLDMSCWDIEPVPERKWAILNRVPLNQAGLFSGEGGAGKSIIELTKNV